MGLDFTSLERRYSFYQMDALINHTILQWVPLLICNYHYLLTRDESLCNTSLKPYLLTSYFAQTLRGFLV